MSKNEFKKSLLQKAPKLPEYHAQYQAIQLEPLAGSGEKFTVLVLARSAREFKVLQTIDRKTLKCMFDDKAKNIQGFINLIKKDAQRHLSHDGDIETWRPPISGVTKSKIHNARSATGMEGILYQALSTYASLNKSDFVKRINNELSKEFKMCHNDHNTKNEIIKLAYDLPKKTVKKLSHTGMQKLLNSENLSKKEIAALYRRHLPKIKKGVKVDSYDWLWLFRQKIGGSPVLKFIYCDGENLISSNGSAIAHIKNRLGLEKGFYGKSKEKIDLDFNPLPGMVNFKETIRAQCETLIDIKPEIVLNAHFGDEYMIGKKCYLVRKGELEVDGERIPFRFNASFLSLVKRNQCKIVNFQISIYEPAPSIKAVKGVLVDYKDGSQAFIMSMR